MRAYREQLRELLSAKAVTERHSSKGLNLMRARLQNIAMRERPQAREGLRRLHLKMVSRSCDCHHSVDEPSSAEYQPPDNGGNYDQGPELTKGYYGLEKLEPIGGPACCMLQSDDLLPLQGKLCLCPTCKRQSGLAEWLCPARSEERLKAAIEGVIVNRREPRGGLPRRRQAPDLLIVKQS